MDEGSQLWRRVRSAVGVLLGGNAGEVAFALIGSALSGESPLNARQLLLVNLMTDALPAAALAVSTPSENGSEKSETDGRSCAVADDRCPRRCHGNRCAGSVASGPGER